MWREIPEFPGYSVSSGGRVRNDRSMRDLTRIYSPRGVYVGLTKNGIQYNRVVSRLVGNAFLDPPSLPYHIETFDTPINIDGDRTNNCSRNLMWRPRWFAVKYHQQFYGGWDRPKRVQEVTTGKEFEHLLAAAVSYGLLALDIYVEAMNHGYYDGKDAGVWPTGQHFMMVLKTHNKARINRGL